MAFDVDFNQLMVNVFFYQETFEAGLNAFENEGIARVTALKDELVRSQHEQSPAIIKRHDDLIKRYEHCTV